MWGPAQVAGAAAFNTRHRDLNVCRTIVTYAGPGTHVAHEVSILHISTATYFLLYLLTIFYVAHKDGVTRGDDGSIDAADAQRAVQLATQHGPNALARSTLWPTTAPEARPVAPGRPLSPRGELAAWQPKRGCGGTLVPATRRQFHRLWPSGARRRAPHEGWALGAGIAWRRRGAPRSRDWARAHLHCAPAHAQSGRVRRLLKPEQVAW